LDLAQDLLCLRFKLLVFAASRSILCAAMFSRAFYYFCIAQNAFL
jgi:hypothetical protein